MPPTTWVALLILIFFVPGFIIDTVYGLSTTRPKRETSATFLAYLSGSLVNAALFTIPFLIALPEVLRLGWQEYLTRHSWLVSLFVLGLLFVIPLALGVMAAQATRLEQGRRALQTIFGITIGHPPKAWDQVFTSNVSYQLLITMEDGTRFGGGWGKNSFSSGFPADEDLYLEVQFKVDPDGKLLEPVENTAGILLKHSAIRSIELFRPAAKDGETGETNEQQTNANNG